MRERLRNIQAETFQRDLIRTPFQFESFSAHDLSWPWTMGNLENNSLGEIQE